MKILARPIEVISWTLVKGKPVPLKFKYQEGDSGTIVYKVDKITQIEERKLAGILSIIYRCQSQIGNQVKEYELKYVIPDYSWQLYKA